MSSQSVSVSPGRLRLIILCAMLVLLVSMGVRATSGLLMQPMTQAHGWTRADFAFAFALQNLVWGLANPLYGAIADRLGSGRAIVVGALFYAAGLLMMRYVETPLGLDLASGLLVGLGLSGTTFGVLLGVVARNAPPEKRSMALGLTAAGGSMGQFVMLPVGQELIGGLGWSGALIGLALCAALIVPLAGALTGRNEATGSDQSIRQALGEAWRHPSFHFIFWSFFTCGFHTAFITLHFPSYMMDIGLGVDVGVRAVALIGLFNVIGTYGSGVLGGKYSKKTLLAYTYYIRSAVILAFILAPKTPTVVYLFAAAMGLLWLGTVPLTNGLVADIYGTRYVSMLVGVVFLGHQFGSFFGAWLGGYAFEHYQSYQSVWILSVVVGVTAGLLCLPIREHAIERLTNRVAAAPRAAV